MRRRIKKLAVLLVLLGLAVSWPVVLHYRAKSRVARYNAGLKQAGEKLSIDELAPPPEPEAFNAALDLVSLADFLGTGSGTSYPPVMRYAGPGKALVGWQQPVLPNSETTNVWPGLGQEITSNRETISALCSSVKGAPSIALDLDYRQGWGMSLSKLSMVRSGARWICAATVFDLHEERVANALEELQTLVELGSRQGREPVILIELVRIAICAYAVGATWEALQSSSCSETNLSALQTSWQSVELLTQAESALAMERAFATRGYSQARTSPSAIVNFAPGTSTSAVAELEEFGKQVLQNPRAGLKELFSRYPAYWVWRWWQSYDDELADAQIAQAGIEALRKARREKTLGPALKQFGEESLRIRQKHPGSGGRFGYPVMSGTQNFLNRIMLMEIQRSLVVTAIALKRYSNARGVYPENLAMLIPEFLLAPPLDPVDGQPLRYKLNADGSFALYSVGEDGLDNGGDPSTVPGAPKMWWRARDAVWPAPANPEETKETMRGIGPKMVSRYGLAPGSSNPH